MNSSHRSCHDSELGGIEPRRLKIFNEKNLEHIGAFYGICPEMQFDMKVVASVLPFRVNQYVIEELIDWSRLPDDPIFQLTFPQRGMLDPQAFERMAALHRRRADHSEIAALACQLRNDLNPHPDGQLELNRTKDSEGAIIEGLQHKYRETVLCFPSQGQTCHSYCTFCFRWAQFIGDKELHIALSQVDPLLAYLRAHQDVSDLLVTGGDPMVMKTRSLAQYLEPLLTPPYDHVQTVRIGTKALTFWPYRFVTDDDADALLRLLERMVNAGKHVAIMAHYNHWRELVTPVAHAAIWRLRETGASLYAQGPLLAHINDDPAVWTRLWREQVRLGIQPYYMFVERDTGARRYFEIPLVRAWQTYREAIQAVSGLARTVRGPSMSASPGKIEVQGVAQVQGETVFVLRFLQGRNPDWVQRPFFARFDPAATWLDQLRPAFGEQRFFFEDEFAAMLAAA